MEVKPSGILSRLEELKATYGPDPAQRKLNLLGRLEKRTLARAGEVMRLHDVLCFLRAYPDDGRVLDQVERMLATFAARKDLRRHRTALANSGVAGTPVHYRFYWFTATWLARRWPDRLHIEWADFDRKSMLDNRLTMLMPYSESPALEELGLPVRRWIERLKGPSETDAAFVVRRFERLRADSFGREKLYEELDIPCRLDPGPDTPSRTRARYGRGPVVFQTRPLELSRSSFRAALRSPPVAVRSLPPREAQALIDLSREAMIARLRDLDVFVHADRRDVRLLDCGRGLQFASLGAVPERRQMLDAVYGFLILKNAVPIGYLLTSSLLGSSEVAYNIFETYRGAEAAYIYGRALAVVRHLFRADSFTVDPYQLGHGNREGLESGAWWFYYKLGFRPKDPEVVDIVAQELRRMKAKPRHRSSLATLEKLSAANMHLHLGRKRRDVIGGAFSRENVGFHIIGHLAERFGSDREAGVRACSREASRLLGVRSRSKWSRDERLAWERWAPLIAVLPDVERWSRDARSALVRVVRAKGGRRESDFVTAFDRHRALRRAVLKLSAHDPGNA